MHINVDTVAGPMTAQRAPLPFRSPSRDRESRFQYSGWLSEHARVRMQQRGIPAEVVECLLDFGRAHHDHHGGRILCLDKTARGRLRRLRGDATYRALDKHLDAYAVLDSTGRVITVGHRYHRIRHA